MPKHPTSSSPLRLGQWVMIPAHSGKVLDHLELGRVIGGCTVIEDGLRLTLYQVRTLRDRTMRIPAEMAGWFPAQEIAA